MNIRYYFNIFIRNLLIRLLNNCEDMEAERFPVTPVIVEINYQYPYVLDRSYKQRTSRHRV